MEKAHYHPKVAIDTIQKTAKEGDYGMMLISIYALLLSPFIYTLFSAFDLCEWLITKVVSYYE